MLSDFTTAARNKGKQRMADFQNQKKDQKKFVGHSLPDICTPPSLLSPRGCLLNKANLVASSAACIESVVSPTHVTLNIGIHTAENNRENNFVHSILNSGNI